MDGWVKLHRDLLNWEWSTSHKHWVVFTKLLLKAAHRPINWRDVALKPGQVITGRVKFSLETGVSERGIRTVFRDLQKSGEITIRTTSKFSVISIVNWDKYQDRDQQLVEKRRVERPATRPSSDLRATTYKNVKNVKKERIKGVTQSSHAQKVPDSLSYLNTEQQEWLSGITQSMADTWNKNWNQEAIASSIDEAMNWNATAPKAKRFKSPPLAVNKWLKRSHPIEDKKAQDELADFFEAGIRKIKENQSKSGSSSNA